MQRTDGDETTPEKQEAALKIQTEFRRHQAVKEADKMRDERLAEQVVATETARSERKQFEFDFIYIVDFCG